MKIDNDKINGFEFDEKFNTRTLELLDESQALQLAEGLRLGSALSNLHAREYNRFERKYGKDHPRTLEMADRLKTTGSANKVLFSHYMDASTPYVDPGGGWAVDGFVRTADGNPVLDITVAAYDRQDRRYTALGYACTNEKGYFSIILEKLPGKVPSPVYMRASKGRKLLDANEVQLSPEPRSSDRIVIIIDDTGSGGECMSPADAQGKPMPPEQPPGGKEKPVPDGSEKEERRKAPEVERKTVKEKVEQKIERSKPTTAKSAELSAIKGIGPQRLKILENANIKDVKTFVATDKRKLAKLLGDLDFKVMKSEAGKMMKKS